MVRHGLVLDTASKRARTLRLLGGRALVNSLPDRNIGAPDAVVTPTLRSVDERLGHPSCVDVAGATNGHGVTGNWRLVRTLNGECVADLARRHNRAVRTLQVDCLHGQ